MRPACVTADYQSALIWVAANLIRGDGKFGEYVSPPPGALFFFQLCELCASVVIQTGVFTTDTVSEVNKQSEPY